MYRLFAFSSAQNDDGKKNFFQLSSSSKVTNGFCSRLPDGYVLFPQSYIPFPHSSNTIMGKPQWLVSCHSSRLFLHVLKIS